MKNLKSIVTILLIAVLASCSKTEDPIDANSAEQVYPPYVYTANVYVSGKIGSAATIWKNGVPTSLPDGTFASCVFVFGTDVYAGGRQKLASGQKGKIWKNGVALYTLASNWTVMVNSVFVLGTDVYACGFVQNIVEGQQPCYWKNGILTILANASGAAGGGEASGITATGNTVYIAGQVTNPSFYTIAKTWKVVGANAPVETNLSATGIDTITTGISVIGTNVYVSGYEKVNNKTSPIYYTNTTRTALPYRSGTDGWANGVTANASNIYVSGYDTNSLASGNAYYWKDGAANNLTSPTTDFNSRDHSWAPSGIAVFNGSVFQSAQDGYLGNGNAMFLDGARPVYLTNSESVISDASGIFVTPIL